MGLPMTFNDMKDQQTPHRWDIHSVIKKLLNGEATIASPLKKSQKDKPQEGNNKDSFLVKSSFSTYPSTFR